MHHMTILLLAAMQAKVFVAHAGGWFTTAYARLRKRFQTRYGYTLDNLPTLAGGAAATADASIRERGSTQKIDVYPVAVDQIFKNTIVAVNAAGFLIPAADTAGIQVVGIAEKNVDNGSGSAGDLSCPVRSGVVVRLTSTSTLTQAMVGDLLYAENDQEIGITADVTNLIAVGRMVEFVSATQAWVWIAVAGEGKHGDLLPPTGVIHMGLVDGQDGGSDDTYPISGSAVGDEVVFVGHLTTKAAIATLADITADFSFTAPGIMTDGAGTNYSSDQLLVFWIDRTV